MGETIATMLLLCASPVLAQQAVIDRCKQTSSDADRIACLEAALLGREVREPEPPTRSQIDPPSMQLDTAPPDSVPEMRIPPAAVEAPREQPPARPPAEKNEKEPVGIGAEQVIARQRDGKPERDEARGLAVTGYDYVPYRKLVVTLANGQVWRQIRGDDRYVRVNLERNQTVDITESAMSGYTLRLNEMQREIRVERVR
jgi:hypothetical protein